MMEVDMQSPPPTFRPAAFSVKRPRSPGSPTQERQTKRPLLTAITSEGQCARRTSTALDGQSTSQDDWVRQAKELSITSPLFTVSFPSSVDTSLAMAHGRADEHMAVDYEEVHTQRAHAYAGSARAWATKHQPPSIHIATTSATAPAVVPNGHLPHSPAPFSVLTEPPSSSTDPALSTASVLVTHASLGSLPPPAIFLFPATPSDTPSHQHQFTNHCAEQTEESASGPHARVHDHGLSQSSLTRGQDRIDGSPRPSRAPDILPACLAKKHRVTMGPRADCLKCRTGVRGHWMHFD